MPKYATIPIRVVYELGPLSKGLIVGVAVFLTFVVVGCNVLAGRQQQAREAAFRNEIEGRLVNVEFALDGVDAGRVGLLEMRMEDARKRLAAVEASACTCPKPASSPAQ